MLSSQGHGNLRVSLFPTFPNHRLPATLIHPAPEVVLLEGLKLLRPEKAWRPIITVEVDRHHTHETVLGVDGQNVNQKESFKL